MTLANVAWRHDNVEAGSPRTQSVIEISKLMTEAPLDIADNRRNLSGDQRKVAIHRVAGSG